ncbi:hypothetical protein DPMN_182899 [Dreissena polymorpha]|uniref:Uncharacterized protein n=1 Tax=Dreissena polymorpha TaxID=45954 RepID=A0A9D4DGJ6_DREPO|nr:hypothetical protein DPMN_182899 [Dreissena polymorpha]
MQSPNQVTYNMSNMAAMNVYHTTFGAFYLPQPQQVQYHQMQPMAQQLAQQTVHQGQGMTQTFNDNLSQIIDRLNSVDSRLAKLEPIQSQLSELNTKMSSIETCVMRLETDSKEIHTRMSNIEGHRELDSKHCENIKSKQCFLESELKDERDRIHKLESEIQKSNSVQGEIKDLKARSMRNNLVFFSFPECTTTESRRSENCTKSLHDFMKSSLNIEHADSAIRIERAHRVGRFESGKTRPVVAMFSHYRHKELIKQKCRDISNIEQNTLSSGTSGTSGTPHIRCSDQFPPDFRSRVVS